MHAFQKQQQGLTAAIRNPEASFEGMAPRRLAVYQELFFNNVHSFLSSGFPVLRSVLGAEAFGALARRYFREHRAQTPYFLEISQEFMAYVQAREPELVQQLPWLIELMHFEWAELAAEVAELDEPFPAIPLSGKWSDKVPVWSPAAWLLAYDYPVHELVRSGAALLEKRPTLLLVYRSAEGEVGFLELGAMAARLVVLLQELPDVQTAKVLDQLVDEFDSGPDELEEGANTLLDDLYSRGVVIGVRG